MTTTNQPTAAQPIDLDKLEALARAATPGPWAVRLDGTCSGTWPHIDVGIDEYGDPITVAELSTTHVETETARKGGGMPETYENAPERFELTEPQPLSDAQFIAAANPATILALIALARQQPVARVDRIISASGLAEVSVFLESALKVGTVLCAAPVHAVAAPSAEQASVDWIYSVLRDVGELDYDSPQDQPDMLMVTTDELFTIVRRHAPSAGAAAKSEQAPAAARRAAERIDAMHKGVIGVFASIKAEHEASAAGAGSEQRPAAQARLDGAQVFEFAAPYFAWNAESWQKATQGTIGMPALLNYTRAVVDAAGAGSAPHAQAEPVYQVRVIEQSWAWTDASEEAYHTFSEKRRRILYAAPVPQEAEQADRKQN